MIRKLLVAALLTLLPAAAQASNCSSNPFTMLNGQTADATQVMSNFNNLLNCANNNLAHNGANSDITALSGLSTPLAASEGGSGVAAPTANSVLLGNGASAFQTVAPSTSGNVLKSNGTIWVADLGPGPVFIQTKTASGSATLDFTSNIDSTYNEYLFVLTGVVPATNAVVLNMRISTDGGATYKAAGTDYQFAINSLSSAGTNTPAGSTGTSVMQLSVSLSNNAGRPLAGEVRMFSPAAGLLSPFNWQVSNFDGTNLVTVLGSGIYTTGTPINAIRFIMSAGNITSGTISLYGVRK